MRLYIENSHWIGLISLLIKNILEVDHGQLGENDFVESGCVDVTFNSVVVIYINCIFLYYVQEVSVCNSHKDLLDFFLRIEILQAIATVFCTFFLAKTQLVNMMTHV